MDSPSTMPALETPAAPTESGSTIDLIIRRAGSLYTLPAVAVDVLQLTDSPKVDVRALKACIERDPALTVKILRVVNSSIFGLPREVSDLNQALALLGIKPLKLLALGFSLPESLFVAAAREQLDWFWRSALVRAVAAREISEQLFSKPGDDAFLAGLLQDLGVLVLLGQFGRPYATLLNEVIAAQVELNVVEQAAIGVDHRQLTAALLEHWNLPPLLIMAISADRDVRHWAHNRAEQAHLVRVVHLAELLAQLVGQRRLSVLPDLLQAGEAYCQLDRDRLNELIAALEPRVRQLAGVLSLEVADSGGYVDIVLQAHQQMSELAEAVAGPLSRNLASEAAGALESEVDGSRALQLARQLRASFAEFYAQPATEPSVCQPPGQPPLPRAAQRASDLAEPPALDDAAALQRDDVATRLTLAVGQCRSSRSPLSIVLVGV
ncbi:MAG: HDOD domain-containing protein, partial [Pirellulales bacterium]|nr:HDOD domain-containing protein [Pirellulales bacterium]